MKLNEFIEEETKRLTTFERYWHKEARENPEQFLFELEPGDWDEQFRCFKEMVDE